MEAKEEPKKDEPDAEDEMIERALNDAIMQAMVMAVDMGVERPDDSQDPPKDAIIKQCPLCKSPCRYFNVNLRDRILSCENSQCDYPYGYEEITLVPDPHWSLADDVDLAKIIPELVLTEAELTKFPDIDGIENKCNKQASKDEAMVEFG